MLPDTHAHVVCPIHNPRSSIVQHKRSHNINGEYDNDQTIIINNGRFAIRKLITNQPKK